MEVILVIKRLEIKGFGKFKNYIIEPNEKLNIHFAPNEGGKSTIVAFIFAMFYGLKGGREGKDGSLSQLLRFKPWDNGFYGGAIEYTLENGENYRIERNFDIGIVKVFDKNFKEITHTFEIDREKNVLFAQKHLGINKEIFVNSCIITATSFSPDEAVRNELSSRLSQRDEKAEDINFAIEGLEKQIKEWGGSQRTSNSYLDQIEKELNALYEHKEKMMEKIIKKSQIEFNKSMLSEQFVELMKWKEMLEIGLKLNQTKIEKRSSQENVFILEEAIFNDVSKLKTSKKITYIHAICGLLIIMGVVSSNYIEPINNILIKCIFAVFLIFWLISLPISLKKRVKIKENRYYKNLKNEAVRNAEIQLGKRFDNEKQIKELLQDQCKKMDNYNDELVRLMEEINIYFNDKDICENTAFHEILSGDTKDVTERLVNKINEAEADIQNIKLSIKEQDTIALMEGIGFEEKLEKLLEEISILEKKKMLVEDTVFSLKVAVQNLKEALEEHKENTNGVIETQISSMMHTLTLGKYTRVKNSGNLQMLPYSLEDGIVVNRSQLSGGTLDQLNFSLRTSISGHFSENYEELPLILDEPFYRYDDKRIINAFEIIKEISSNRQIFFFTCRQWEADLGYTKK